MKTYKRYVWIAMRGVPLFLWSKETMTGIAEEWGTLLAMDKETEYAKRLDEARLLV